VLLYLPMKIVYGGRGETNDVCCLKVGPLLASYVVPSTLLFLIISLTISFCCTDGNWNAIFTFLRSNFLSPTFFSLLFLMAWLLFCFPQSVSHLYQQIFCRCRFLLLVSGKILDFAFGDWLRLSGVPVKPLERLPEQTLGRIFYSPAPLFLALALLNRGVVFPERLNGLDAWSFISVTSPSWGIWWRCRPVALTVVSFELGARVFLDP
jgi:hypothetical protein